MIFGAEGGRGKLPPASIFFKFPVCGKLEKISLCSHTGSACYYFPERIYTLSGF